MDINNYEAEMYIKFTNLITNKINKIPSKIVQLPTFENATNIIIEKKDIDDILYNQQIQEKFINKFKNLDFITDFNVKKEDIYNSLFYSICEDIAKCKNYQEIDTLYQKTQKLVAASINENYITKKDFIKILSLHYFLIKSTDLYSITFQGNFVPNFIIKEFINNHEEQNKIINNEPSIFYNEFFSYKDILDSYFSYLLFLENKCTSLKEINKLYDDNNYIIQKIIKKYGFNVSNSLLTLLASTSIDLIEVGLSFNYFNDITNDKFKDKVDTIINNKKDKIFIDDYDDKFFNNYLFNLAYNKDFNDEKYYNHLFDMLSQKIYKDDIINVIYKQILINYGKKQIEKQNIKNTYIFSESKIDKYRGNNIDGCCTNFVLNDEYYHLINIKEIDIEYWDYSLSVIMHEINHATQFGHSKEISLRQFRIDLESFINDFNQKNYNQNFNRLFYEVESHNYGYNYAKNILNNNLVVDLDQIEFYDNAQKEYIENENNILRFYNGKEDNIFTIYKKILKIFKLVTLLNQKKKKDVYNINIYPSLKLITNSNLTMKSDEEIEDLLNNSSDPDEKEIYKFVLNNKDSIRKRSK